MGIFRRSRRHRGPPRYKILILAEDGEILFWHKRGELHIVDEDVARIFVSSFKPELFQVTDDGTLKTPEPGKTRPILRVEMVAIDEGKARKTRSGKTSGPTTP